MKKAVFVIGDGTEELEFMAPLDILIRGGFECQVFTPGKHLNCRGRNGIPLTADDMLPPVPAEESLPDVLVLPGGPAAKAFLEIPLVGKWIRECHRHSRWVAAICAAPLLLQQQRLLEGIPYTGHPSIAEALPALSEHPVVISGKVITSRGAGTAILFGLTILREVTDHQLAEEVRNAIVG